MQQTKRQHICVCCGCDCPSFAYIPVSTAVSSLVLIRAVSKDVMRLISDVQVINDLAKRRSDLRLDSIRETRIRFARIR